MPTPNPNAVPINLQPGYDPAGSGLEQTAEQLAGQTLAPRAPARYEPPDNGGAGDSFYASNDYTDPYTQPEFYERLTNQPPPTGWEQDAFAGPQVDPTKIPNYEKLSPIEQGIMSMTAGWKNTPWGQAADQFSQNPVIQFIGKGLEPILGAFDVGAETLERGTGFLTQGLEAFAGGDEAWKDFKSNLTSAWYAGSLSADMSRTLSHSGDVDSVGDFLKGFKFDDDLPGNAGLIAARQRIADVVAQGGTYRQGLDIAKAEYMDSLGALAFRAQIHDTGFHLLADPLNILLPMIKPVEWTKSATVKLQNLADGAGLETIAKGLTDAEEALKVAQQGGDAVAITRAEEALASVRQVEQDYKVARKLSWGEQMMTRLFGGPEKLLAFGDEKLTGLGKLLTPFQLTPQAKASEYAGNILDNFLNYFINPNAGKTGEIDFMGLTRDMTRVRDGALDPRLAHMLVTPEGRMTREALEGLTDVAGGIAAARQQVAAVERPLFDLAKDALGVTPTALMQRIQAGEIDAILKQVASKLQATPELVTRLQSIAQRAGVDPSLLLTADGFGTRMAPLMVPGMEVYDDQLLLLNLANRLGESVAQRSIAMFGLKERGAVQAWSDALKSAESLAYLRLNPAYPIRNKVNNIITMIARGAYGNISESALRDYWKLRGGEPARLFSGLGPAEVAAKLVQGDEVHALAQAGAVAGRTVSDVVKGKGLATTFEQMVSKFGDGLEPVLGKLGFGGQVASNSEARAGALATTVGDMQGHRIFAKPGGGILAHAKDIMNPDIARTIGDDVIREIEGIASKARTPQQLDELTQLPNWKLDVDNLLARADSQLGGLTVDDIFGADFRHTIQSDLQTAVDSGPRAVNDFFEGLYAKTEQHLKTLTDTQIRDLALEVESKVAAEGPKAGVDLYNQSIDTLRASESAHQLRMSQLADEARKASGKASDSLWRNIQTRERAFFDNTWKRMETINDGIVRAAKKAGFDGSSVETAFKEWRGTWKKFYAGRDKINGEFWEAIAKGEQPRLQWSEVQALNDEAYKLAVAKERAATSKLDRAVSEFLPEGLPRDTWLAWRKKMLALRETDAQLVETFRDELASIKGQSARYEAYLKHNQERRALMAAGYQEKQAYEAALKGNPRAQATYTDIIQQSQEELQLGYSAFDKVQAGQPLSPDEAQAWKRLVEDYADPDEIEQLRRFDKQAAEVLHANQTTLFAEANKAGIPTATKTGKPTYNQLVNSLNKHKPPDIQPFSMAEIRAGLTDQRLAEAQYSLALRQWEPDPLRRMIRENAAYLRNELSNFEGPAMIRKDAADAGVSYTRTGSGRPDWLQEIARETGYTYDELRKVLTDIANGKVVKGESRKLVEDALIKAGEQDINPITGVAKGEGDIVQPPRLEDFLPGRKQQTSTIEPAPTQLQPWEMTSDELRDYAKQLRNDEKNAAKEIFGEQAKEYELAQKIVNNPGLLPQVDVDRAEALISKLEGSLTPEQEKRLFGIGETGPNYDDIRVMARKVADVESSATPDELADAITRAITDIGDATDPAAMTSTQLEAYAQLRAANQVAADNGWNIAEIASDAAKRAARRWEPADAEIMLERWLKPQPKPEPELARIAAPEATPLRSQSEIIAEQRADLEREIGGRFTEATFNRAFGVEPLTEEAAQAFIPSLADVGIKPEYYLSQLSDEAFNIHGQFALDALRDETLKAMKEPPLNYQSLSPLQQAEVRRYLNHAKAAIPDINSASLKFGQWKRDSALLNYSRRTNFDSWLGTMAPFSFWTTHSGYNWALHSIDRPAMLSTYYRMNKWLKEAYNPQPGSPSRFRGQLRVHLPFISDWMGDQFIDPFSMALPFDNWKQPFDDLENQQVKDEGTARRKLDELLAQGQITQADYDAAQGSQSGATWERALALVQQDDKDNRYDALDFAMAFANPHAPLLWGINALRGKKDPTGGNTFLPITRTISAASQALRISPLTRPYIPPGGWNIEAGLRQALGLHPMLDKWQDYRIDRELSNMVADGLITVDEAKRAMIERSGEAYDTARDREGYQRSLTTGTGFLGLPLRSYPTGEEHLRNLADDYRAAWAAYDRGDSTALDAFNQSYPEYEARLGLYKQPGERIRDYLIDNLWDKWNSLPQLHKNQVSDQLGPLFDRAFLDKELRDYESISDGTLGTWLKLLGGNPPGTLQTTRNDIPPLDLAPPEITQTVQQFYDQRKLYFPDYRELQSQYFALPEKGNERRAFRANNPQLTSYWDWRRDWLDSNPDAAVYLTDNSSTGKDTTSGGGGGQPYTYSQPDNMYQAVNPSPIPYAQWQSTLGDELMGLVDDYTDGSPLPENIQRMLVQRAAQMGVVGSYQDIIQRIYSARDTTP